MPIQNSMRRSWATPALRSTIAFCASMAQRTASTTLRNLTSAPSPVRLNTSVVHGDGGIDEIAAQSSEPRQGAILVRAGKATETDHIGGKDRREFPFFRHRSLSRCAT